MGISLLVVSVPVDACFLSLGSEKLYQLGTDDLLAESLLLKELKVLQCRTRPCEISQIRRAAPVLQVFEILDECGVGQELLRCEVIQVEGIRERLDELHCVSLYARDGTI